MRLLDAQVLDGDLLLVIHGSAAEMFGAKAAIAKTLGCGVHLVTAGMMRRVRGAYRKPGESNLAFLARIAIIDTIAGEPLTPEPVIVRRRGVMSGEPVFRGTRVPPGPVFSMLAEKSAGEIVRVDYPSLSRSAIETALQRACRLLEREAPWVERW
jgi:uncharacterized protein (DUF433 family)